MKRGMPAATSSSSSSRAVLPAANGRERQGKEEEGKEGEEEDWDIDDIILSQTEDEAASAKVALWLRDKRYVRLLAKSVERRPDSGDVEVSAEEHVGGVRVPYVVLLRGVWSSLDLRPGDVFNFVWDLNEGAEAQRARARRVGPKGAIVLDASSENRCLVVTHPDTLVNGVAIGESYYCPRKTALRSRYSRGKADVRVSSLCGQAFHEAFEAALLCGDVTEPVLREGLAAALKSRIPALAALGATTEDVAAELDKHVAPAVRWAAAFFGPSGARGAECPARGDRREHVVIDRALAAEEAIWSPMLGMKGVLDAVGEVRIGDNDCSGSGGASKHAVLELKTGAESEAYRAQVEIYLMMLAARYGVKPAGTVGLLIYLGGGENNSSKSKRAPPAEAMRMEEVVSSEIQGIFLQRNVIAASLASQGSPLPPLNEDMCAPAKCAACPCLDECALCAAAYEAVNNNSSGDCCSAFPPSVNEIAAEVTQGLGQAELDFFRRYDRAVALEADLATHDAPSLWLKSPEERASQGKCFPDLLLLNSVESGGTYYHTFIKAPPSRPRKKPRSTSAGGGGSGEGSLMDGKISKGDYVVLSTVAGHVGVANGVIRNLDKEALVLTTAKPLPGPERIASWATPDIEDWGSSNNCNCSVEKRWVVDKNEFASSFASSRLHLVRLLTDAGCERLRQLVVGLEAPLFNDEFTATQISSQEYARLNASQKDIIAHALNARDYLLVLGMPGTGKSTTIAVLVQALLKEGQRVLVTSYTNNAVDNVLEKLAAAGVPFGRFGRADQVPPAVRPHTVDGNSAIHTTADVDAFLAARPVFGATCLGMTHPLLQAAVFDVCIVDEASQISLPATLGPLLHSRRFILVGDHNQLPPLVSSAEARALGLDESLFKRLTEAHPEAVIKLSCQYRMCKEIMSVANALVYDGELSCHSEDVYRAKLAPRQVETTSASTTATSASLRTRGPPLLPWVRTVVDPERRVVFCNTDAMCGGTGARETCQDDVVFNEDEAAVVSFVVAGLVEGLGIPPGDIGVITPYRRQIKAIEALVHKGPSRSVEVNTVDRFQGKEKACLIVSFVRSNPSCSLGDLLKDWRRINVAFTRARCKLIVIGSERTLAMDPFINKFIALCHKNKWVIPLESRCFSSV